MLQHGNRIRHQHGNDYVSDIEEREQDELTGSRGAHGSPTSTRRDPADHADRPGLLQPRSRERAVDNHRVPLAATGSRISVRAQKSGAPTLPGSGVGPTPVRILLATARGTIMQKLGLAALALGLTVSVSPDGLHALMSAVRDPPEVILLDDDLPGVDADWVERMLARDGRTAGARVVRVA